MKALGLLLLLCLLVGITAGYTENFQNGADGWTAGAGSISLVATPYADTYKLYQTATGGVTNANYGAYYGIGTASNYFAIDFTPVSFSGGVHGYWSVQPCDSGGTAIVDLDVGSTPGRIVIERTGGNFVVSRDNVVISTVASGTTQPYYWKIGLRNSYNEVLSFSQYLDNAVVGMPNIDVVGCPPHTWFVGKDILDPSIKGLFDPAYNNVYTDHFDYTISNSTGTTINSYNITNPPTSGTIVITSGTASDYIKCQAVTLSGTNLVWNNLTYTANDNAILTNTITTQYWNSAIYDYHVKITKINTDNTTTVVKTTTVTTANGTTTFTSASDGYFLAELQLAPKTAPNTWYTLASNWSTWLNGIKLKGFTYDGYAGTVLPNVTLTCTQGSSSTSTSSDSSGYYTCNTTFSTGLPITVNASKTNYTASNFTYTFSSPGTMQIDMTLLPYNGTSAPVVNGFPIWNGTAIYGLVTADPYNFAVPGATVKLNGGTNTTTTNTGGYYHFDNLANNTAYTVQANAGGYGTSDLASVSTGVSNSGTRQDLLLHMGFNVTVGVIDYYSGAYIDGATVTVNSGSSQTTSGGKTSYNLPYGYYTFAATKDKYDPGNTSGTIAMNQTVYISLKANSSASQNQNLIYTPHLVRFYFTDEYGNALSGLTITATPTGQTSVPSSWLNSILGLPTSANMPTTVLSGTTGLDGSITFLMAEVINYNILATGTSPINGASISNTVQQYPKDVDYRIHVYTGLHQNLTAMPTFGLNAIPSNDSSTVNLSAWYNDPNGGAATFYVISGGSTVYSTSVSGGNTVSYTAPNTRGVVYTYGFNATNSLGQNGVIQQWQDITMKGPTGATFDFGLDATTRAWIALLSIFAMALIWGGTTVKVGFFLTPVVMGGFWWFFGWLPYQMGAMLMILGFLGALYYMRGQENKTMRS